MTATAPLPVIGFLGAGQMAAALGKGFVTAGVVGPDHLLGYDVSTDAMQRFAAATGGTSVSGVAELLVAARLIVLSVKPQHIPDVLTQIRDLVTSDHLVVSIAAGQSLTRISAGLPPETRLVRVMPNTPCLVGEGAIAFAMGPHCRPGDAQLVQTLLATTGLAVEVPEKLLDAVTGLSGSGPAYVYQIIEALSDGGVRMGLPRDVATRLAAQTVLGAAQMVLATGQHPGQLKDAVTSPGGTTIAGLHELERGGLRGILMDAVEAATERSRELGQS